ncbi:hypothetical protein BTO28_01595 [Domibacillus epiphyticus]|uniref:Uncharacterized protein n=1 Tax=Domibacillus epiphyticus TaxID=1714355 RepID=A0A1V2ACP2_9BACI|nr:hypothetical protein BTO28_01595 [Domibacillus epiphyticus]
MFRVPFDNAVTEKRFVTAMQKRLLEMERRQTFWEIRECSRQTNRSHALIMKTSSMIHDVRM